MLDTLMVLLMKGRSTPLLRALTTFLILCASIGALLLLVIISGVRWPGMAATASSVQGAEHGPVVAPAPLDTSIPIILQNPCAASTTATPSATATLRATAAPDPTAKPGTPSTPASGHSPQGFQPSLISEPTVIVTGPSIGQNPPVLHSMLGPLLSKLLSTGLSDTNPPASCLSNRLATSASSNALLALGPLSWTLLSLAGCLISCGTGLVVVGSRRKRH